jgi:hypothetical protein
MKKIIIWGFVYFFFANAIQSQDTHNPDYITNGYYQLIYEADIALLENNDDCAFQKLQAAEKVCPLIEQDHYHEITNYTKLLIKRDSCDKALYYLEKLASEYGENPLVLLGNLVEDSLVIASCGKTTVMDSVFPILYEKYQKFYTPEKKVLVEELIAICETDQKVREGWGTNRWTDEKKQQMYDTDERNATRLLEIVNEHGFPNTKLYGMDNEHLLRGLGVVLVHISLNHNIKDMILQLIKQGECDPSLYGFIIDRELLEKGGKNAKYLYGIYNNANDDQIESVEQIDERRLSIGMPTRQMEKKRRELLSQKQEE